MFHFPFRQLLERYFFLPNFQQLKDEKKKKKDEKEFCFFFAFPSLSLFSCICLGT